MNTLGRQKALIDLSSLARNLEIHPNGIWYARTSSAIDYPAEGNAFCYQVEEESFWFIFRNRFILGLINQFPPSEPFIDIGGGNGYVSLALQAAGYRTVLVEPGVQGILNAQQRGLEDLVCATIEDAAFTPGQLPAAGMFDVLEHIQDDAGFLDYIHTLLIPGGRIYLTVPAYQFLWSNEDDFAQHYRRYTLNHLINKLTSTGYQVEHATYIFAVLPLPIFLFRTLPSKFNRRKSGDLNKIGAELNPQQGISKRLLEYLLVREQAWLNSAKTLPFGASCLLVAKSV